MALQTESESHGGDLPGVSGGQVMNPILTWEDRFGGFGPAQEHDTQDLLGRTISREVKEHGWMRRIDAVRLAQVLQADFVEKPKQGDKL